MFDMIFYSVYPEHRSKITEQYCNNVMHITYDNTIGRYTVISTLEYHAQSIILHSLSDEDMLHLKLLGIPPRKLYHQDLLLKLYTHNFVNSQFNLYYCIP